MQCSSLPISTSIQAGSLSLSFLVGRGERVTAWTTCVEVRLSWCSWWMNVPALVTGSKVEDAGRLTPLATSLLSLVHQADSLTLWQYPVSLSAVTVWAAGRAVCAQCSGCLVVAASRLHVRITTDESTQFSCSLVQTAPFPRHRGTPRHLRKFRGAACYSAARGKPWALVMTPDRTKMSLLMICASCMHCSIHLFHDCSHHHSVE